MLVLVLVLVLGLDRHRHRLRPSHESFYVYLSDCARAMSHCAMSHRPVLRPSTTRISNASQYSHSLPRQNLTQVLDSLVDVAGEEESAPSNPQGFGVMLVFLEDAERYCYRLLARRQRGRRHMILIMYQE